MMIVRLTGLGLAAALASLPALAQTAASAARLPTVQHRIQVGDTLEQLARRYLGDTTQWQALQQHNGNIDPYRLPPGQFLEIPLNLLRAATASVDYVQGTASLHRSGQAAQPVQRGQPLREGDALALDPEAFVTVLLADGSTVRVQANSQITLQQLRRRGRAGSLQSVLELQQGGVEVAVPGRPDATRRLEVHTPMAATSVRGTRFDVQVTDNGSSSAAVEHGRVALQGQADTAVTVLRPGLGAAVRQDGHATAPVRLLPAPNPGDLPATASDAQWLDLSLPPLADASAYQVQVAADPAGQQVLRNGRFATPQVRFASLADGDYWLQVRGLDAHGIRGQAAQAPLRIKAHPVAPLASHPAPQAIAAQGSTQLACTPVDEAQAYVLQVAALGPAPAEGSAPPASVTAADAAEIFAAPVAQAVDVADCALDLATLPPGTYAWRTASVRWVGGVRDQGPFGIVQTFALQPPPALPQEVQVQSHQGHTTIFWTGGPGQRYRLQALATPEAAEPQLDLWLDAPQWTVSGLPAGTWHVRLQVQDGNGLLSRFSPTRSVQMLPLVQDGSGNTVGTGSGLGLLH